MYPQGFIADPQKRANLTFDTAVNLPARSGADKDEMFHDPFPERSALMMALT